MSRAVSLIGDEIRVDGMLVALLVPTQPPASIIGDFLDFMVDPVTYLEDWFDQEQLELLRDGTFGGSLPCLTVRARPMTMHWTTSSEQPKNFHGPGCSR